MPSPVGHTLFGLGVYVIWCRNLRDWVNQIPLIIWVVFCANLPDFDFFIGITKGELNKYHQGYTHTLGFAAAIGIFSFLVLKIIKKKNALSISFLTFLVVFSHVLLDAFNYDSRAPIGVMLFWPFSKRYISLFPIFYPVPHSYLGDIMTLPFISAVICEILLLFIPLFLLVFFKWRKSDRKG